MATIDIGADVDYFHIKQYREHQHLTHLEEAVTDKNSRAHASLYAEVPRTFGLALPEASKDVRKQFFDSMKDKQMGGVTFRLLLAWTIEHSKGKIALNRAQGACFSFDQNMCLM